MRASGLIAMMACVFVASVGAAQPVTPAKPEKPAPITVVLEDLGCSTAAGPDTFEARTWSWGATLATTSTSGGGSGAGKAVLDGLKLTRAADSCSPALVGALVIGKHFKKLTLSQYHAAGVLKATVALDNVILAHWQIGGTNTSAEATEQVEMSFERFTFTDVASSNRVCFDTARQAGC